MIIYFKSFNVREAQGIRSMVYRKLKKKEENLVLDWFTVRYGTIFLFFVIVVAVVVAGFFFYQNLLKPLPPSELAGQEINKAEKLFSRSSIKVPEDDESLKETLQKARKKLERAREKMQEKLYEVAIEEAKESQKHSTDVLETIQERSGKYVAEVIYREGRVRVKRAKLLRWDDCHEGMKLHHGDLIESGSNGGCTLRYINQTTTRLRPNSSMRIEELTLDRVSGTSKLKIYQDKGESTTEPGHDTNTTIDTPVGAAIVDGADSVEVELYEDGKKGRFSSRDGQATYKSTRGREYSIEKETEIIFDAKRKRVHKQKKPPAPKLIEPFNSKVFRIKKGELEAILLKWERARGANRYKVEISSSPSFLRLLSSKTMVSSDSVKIPNVPPGNYYWRIRSVNPNKVMSIPSAIRSFRVVESEKGIKGRKPPKLVTKEKIRFEYKVLISGETDPGVLLVYKVNEEPKQKVEVEEDGTFQLIIQLTQEGKNVIQFTAQDAFGIEKTVEVIEWAD